MYQVCFQSVEMHQINICLHNINIIYMLSGVLMIFDIFDEREFVRVNSRWDDHDECRFPLFNALQPLAVQWMYIVYVLMLTGNGCLLYRCYMIIFKDV